MAENTSPRSWLRPLLDVVAVIMAIIALYFSWRALELSREANSLAKEGNAIAQSSNEIALSSIGPAVVPQRGTGIDAMWMYGCSQSGSSDYFLTWIVENKIEFKNTGPKTAYLQDVSISGKEGANWRITVLDGDNWVLLPANIAPDSTRELRFVARAIQSDSSEDAIRTLYERDRYENVFLKWAFSFSDGSTLLWQTGAYPSSPGLEFTRTCASLAD